MEILIGQLRNVEIQKSRDEKEVIITLAELDGNYYGTKSDIKIPAMSYEMLEKEIVDRWLEKKEQD